MQIIKRPPIVPEAPRAIKKGMSLADLLDKSAIECLALNLFYCYEDFDCEAFVSAALDGIEGLGLTERSTHIARVLRSFLPMKYSSGLTILMNSFTEPYETDDEFGLDGFFYLIHSAYISEFGFDSKYNDDEDPFEFSMNAMYELTKRSTSEFAIRSFLNNNFDRTLSFVYNWLDDPNSHVRRLCSEGTRPRLPWGKRIQSLIIDPTPTLPLLTKLHNDESLYVRRSVANHLGDIAKTHPQLVYELCTSWLNEKTTKEVKWLIRHALRYPAKKGDPMALEIRAMAK